MIITVLSSVKTQSISKTGKPYTFLELAYKGDDGQVKGKKVMPFGESKVVFDALGSAQGGDLYDVSSVKNEASGYWDWVGAKKSDGKATASAAPTSPSGGKVTGSNYETAEERAKRQVYIVRQSSIANAIAFGKGKTVEDVLNTAKSFENYVFDTGTVPAAIRIEDEFENDIPL